jgi:transposase
MLKLSKAERHTLRQVSVNHRRRDIRTRAVGLLVLGNELSAPKAAAGLDVSAQSIYNWSVRHEVA